MKYLLFLLLLLSANTVFAAETKIFLNGMTCPFCAGKVEDALGEIDGFQVKEVDVVSIQTGEVIIKTKGTKSIPDSVIEKELKGTDYSLKTSKAK